MIILFNRVLMDFEGEEIKTDKKQVLTLKITTVNALLATFSDEANLSGEDKLKRFELAQVVNASTDPVDLIAEDVALIKKLIAKAYATLIVGQAWKMLEGQPLKLVGGK